MLDTHPEINPNPGEDIKEKFKLLWGPSEEWDTKELSAHNYVARRLTELELSKMKY